MIVLYRNKKDAFADKIAEKLKDLVVAHKIEVSDDQSTGTHKLPYIKEGNTFFEGKTAIEDFLLELSNELTQQRSTTGDSCYIDPKTGEVC